MFRAHALGGDRLEPADACRAEILTLITRLPLVVLPVLDGELADAFQFRKGLLDAARLNVTGLPRSTSSHADVTPLSVAQRVSPWPSTALSGPYSA